jgi:hypothetical protein
MIDLLAADLHRIFWRPLTRALGVAIAISVAVTCVLVFIRTGNGHPFDTPSGLRTALQEAAAPLAVAGFVLGASLLGADYTSRALATLLTWQPRRSRVLASRAIACAAVTVGVSLAALALLILALLPAALAHGDGEAPTGSWWLSTAALAARCALLAAGVSVIGVAAAALGRGTTAALAGLGVYWLVIDRTVTSLWPSIGRWLPIADARSWILTNSHTGESADGHNAGHTPATAGLLLLTAILTIHVLATHRLKHRDIT